MTFYNWLKLVNDCPFFAEKRAATLERLRAFTHVHIRRLKGLDFYIFVFVFLVQKRPTESYHAVLLNSELKQKV